MSRTVLTPLVLLGALLWLPPARLAAAEASDVVVEANTTANAKAPSDVTVTFRSPAAGHLFLAGKPVELTAVITSKVAQQATVCTLITTTYGARVFYDQKPVQLPAGGEVTLPITFENSNQLPNGIYRVDVWGEGEEDAPPYGSTTFSVWNGPLDHQVDCFGISYAGPLNSERTWQDLDLFKMAGVGWLRFPLQGWLPQGQTTPAETETYNQFVQEAGKRNFKLLAAFTPKMTVDIGVNELQAGKEYRESLLAATTRYGFKVKDWELLTVKPDPQFPDLKGIRFQDLAQYAPSLKKMDKSLRTIFSLDNPLKWNALELFNAKIPAKGDILGMHYNFVAFPEFKADATPPIFALDDILSTARTRLKEVPPIWVTDYGFDPRLGTRLPDEAMQGALMARALLINRGANIERTFWRHDPAEPWELPFTRDDGSSRASLLALRTTLQMLDGITRVQEVPGPLLTTRNKVWAMLLRYGGGKKKKTRYALVTWLETRESYVTTSLTIKTKAPRLTVTDLWGNAVELQPTSQVAVFTVDAFPRFVDLGENGDAEILSPFARFDPPVVLLTDGGENRWGLLMHNDQRLFHDNLNCEVYIRRWPGKEGELAKRKIDLGPADSVVIPAQLDIPEDAKKGQVYEVSTEIMLGTRRIGYLTIPVWYMPKTETEKKEGK